MTILFVGALSGANVFFYANYGITFPHGVLAHSILFGLMTVGAIMIMKAVFDLALNDRIERKIAAYWERKARDEQQLRKMQESAKQYSSSFNPYGVAPTVEADDNTVGADFLAATLQ